MELIYALRSKKTGNLIRFSTYWDEWAECVESSFEIPGCNHQVWVTDKKSIAENALVSSPKHACDSSMESPYWGAIDPLNYEVHEIKIGGQKPCCLCG